jgi:hypothetical protein
MSKNFKCRKQVIDTKNPYLVAVIFVVAVVVGRLNVFIFYFLYYFFTILIPIFSNKQIK